MCEAKFTKKGFNIGHKGNILNLSDEGAYSIKFVDDFLEIVKELNIVL